MFQRTHRFHASIKGLLDLVMVFLAFATAWVLRFRTELRPVERGIAPDGETLAFLAAIVVVFPIVLSEQGMYLSGRARSHGDEVWGALKSSIIGTVMVVAITYFARDVRYSRLTIGVFAVLAFVYLSVARIGFREALKALRRRGVDLRDVLVVGEGQLAEQVIATLRDHQELGFRIAGLVLREGGTAPTGLDGIPVLGSESQLDEILKSSRADQVVIALPTEHQSHLKGLMDKLAQHTVDVKVVPDLYQYITLCGGLEEFGGLPIISLQHGPIQGWATVAKRLFDIVFSSIAILLLSPIMVVTALLVKLTSKGPVLYAQERMGMDGALFHIWKFRSMRTDSEAAGAQFAKLQDPRRTPIGTFIRKYSIDELPQFFNVLFGSMSLVGPRPERPVFIEKFKKEIPKYHLRHKVKAGVTGWAQINGFRGDTSIEKRIEFDLYYIENWSLFFDFQILVRTALGGFLSKNAY